MNHKKVNLFNQKIKDSQKAGIILAKLRLVASIISLFCFLSLIIILIGKTFLLNQTIKTEKEMDQIQKEINREFQKQFPSHLVGLRVEAIDSFLKEDIGFSEKESRLQTWLASFAPKAVIRDLAMSDATTFTASIIFSTKNEMLAFIKATEDENVSELFANAKLEDFAIALKDNVSSGSAEIITNSVSITGKFL